MDQGKIGKFIQERRKLKNLTQAQLAEKISITDRAISKWENGRGLPDTSLMLDLCDALEITVNELLSGEVIEMSGYEKKAEERLLEMAKEKEKSDKAMLQLEVFIGVIITVVLLVCVFIASFVKMEAWARILLMIAGFIPFIIGCGYSIKIEQMAGYYECQNCHHKYVPTYSQVLFAMHSGRTRYMKCPKCGEMTWNQKTITKE